MKSKYLIFLLAVQLALSVGAQEAIHKWSGDKPVTKACALSVYKFIRTGHLMHEQANASLEINTIDEVLLPFEANEMRALCAGLPFFFHTGQASAFQNGLSGNSEFINELQKCTGKQNIYGKCLVRRTSGDQHKPHALRITISRTGFHHFC